MKVFGAGLLSSAAELEFVMKGIEVLYNTVSQKKSKRRRGLSSLFKKINLRISFVIHFLASVIYFL
jgi:hypothetical protein